MDQQPKYLPTEGQFKKTSEFSVIEAHAIPVQVKEPDAVNLNSTIKYFPRMVVMYIDPTVRDRQQINQFGSCNPEDLKMLRDQCQFALDEADRKNKELEEAAEKAAAAAAEAAAEKATPPEELPPQIS